MSEYKYKEKIFEVLKKHNNRFDYMAVTCEVLGYEYPEGTKDERYTDVVKEIRSMVDAGILLKENISDDVAVISIPSTTVLSAEEMVREYFIKKGSVFPPESKDNEIASVPLSCFVELMERYASQGTVNKPVVDVEKLKEEFETEFNCLTAGQKNGQQKVWSWIESKLTSTGVGDGWVSVETALPDSRRNVLICFINRNFEQRTAHYDPVNKSWVSESYCFHQNQVSHWRELLALPEVAGEGE